MTLSVDASRVVADLARLRDLTSDAAGAQRVAWGEGWVAARAFYAELLGELDLEPEPDQAGNLWTYLPADATSYVAVGSHLDSVPDGGWLDGALGVMVGVGIARALRRREPGEVGLALVDFADEEGARFGRSLFGSSAVSGSLDPEEASGLVDRDGRSLPEVLAGHGVDLAEIGGARERLAGLDAYLELHIEQGPVLEASSADIGIVEGVVGIQRHEVEIAGRSGHAGSTPMRLRRDPVSAFSRAWPRIEELARAAGGLATTGRIEAEPGVVTVIPERVRFSLDLRHADADALGGLIAGAREAVAEASRASGCQARWRALWSVAPTEFDPELLALAPAAASEHGTSIRLYSGPGHDAVEMARRLPTAMMFAPSRRGLSHVREEDTDEEQLLKAIGAFGTWVASILDRGPVGPR